MIFISLLKKCFAAFSIKYYCVAAGKFAFKRLAVSQNDLISAVLRSMAAYDISARFDDQIFITVDVAAALFQQFPQITAGYYRKRKVPDVGISLPFYRSGRLFPIRKESGNFCLTVIRTLQREIFSMTLNSSLSA